MPTSAEDTTPAEVLTAVREYFLDLTADRYEFKDWAGGDIDGGPNLDGDYPLTDFTGDVHLVPCPAKIAGTVALTMADLVTRSYGSWAALDAVTAASNNQVAYVSGDTGEHADPVSTADVPNSGVFAFVTGSGWTFIAPLPVAIDTDPELTANSDTVVPSQAAVKEAIAESTLNLLEVKGSIDCSVNPLFPAALVGDVYIVSVTGLIGGGLGQYVLAGTMLLAHEDNAGGNLGTAGGSWYIIGNASGSGGGAAGPAEVLDVPVGDYDLINADASKYIRVGDTAAKNLNVPANATEALDDDVEYNIYNYGAGNLTIVPAGGVTINPPVGGSLVVPQNAAVVLKRVAEDEFDLIGVTIGEAFYYSYSFFFGPSPEADEVLMIHVAAEDHTITGDFVSCLFKDIGVFPTDTYVLTFLVNEVASGTFSIADTGVVTATTPSGDPISVAEGDVVKVVGQATPDATLANCAFTVRGIK